MSAAWASAVPSLRFESRDGAHEHAARSRVCGRARHVHQERPALAPNLVVELVSEGEEVRGTLFDPMGDRIDLDPDPPAVCRFHDSIRFQPFVVLVEPHTGPMRFGIGPQVVDQLGLEGESGQLDPGPKKALRRGSEVRGRQPGIGQVAFRVRVGDQRSGAVNGIERCGGIKQPSVSPLAA
jgi:hypothetical protein